MKKYVCSFCGYIYDESIGIPSQNIAAGTKWEDLPDDWVCPLCGAAKSEFEEEQTETQSASVKSIAHEEDVHEMHELSPAELSALCSNLSKGCEKQYKAEEAELFKKLAEYFKSKRGAADKNQFTDLDSFIQEDLSEGYARANNIAAGEMDRGALRTLAWGEKVTKILYSILRRFEKEQDALLENTNIYVCEICGFIYIGNDPPVICPICKVPNFKLKQIQRG